MNFTRRQIAAGLFVPALLMSVAGCDTMEENRTASGAGIGAVAGGLAGAIIGNQVGRHNAVTGALIGAAAGGLIGAGVGHYLTVRANQFKQVQDQNVQVQQVPQQQPPPPAPDQPPPPPEPAHIKLIINDTMLFERGSSALPQYGNPKLDQIAKILNEQPDERIIVRGYTSSEGSDESNQALSERRAGAVRNYLIGHGIDGGRITAVGMGESNPIGDNSTASGASQNRRVEIEVFPGPHANSNSSQDNGNPPPSNYDNGSGSGGGSYNSGSNGNGNYNNGGSNGNSNSGGYSQDPNQGSQRNY